jgi:hypothetical protein
MNHFYSIPLAFALAIPAFAQDAKTNAGANANAAGQFFPASAAGLTAPMVLTNGCIVLSGEQADVTNGGKALFNFTVTNAGNYLIEAQVNAPDESSNSFFLNIDAMPEDPDMIWDVELTTGFEARVADWRGNGSDPSSDEFAPKLFNLKPGAHQIVLVGREPGTLLKSLTVRLAPPEPRAGH